MNAEVVGAAVSEHVESSPLYNLLLWSPCCDSHVARSHTEPCSLIQSTTQRVYIAEQHGALPYNDGIGGACLYHTVAAESFFTP